MLRTHLTVRHRSIACGALVTTMALCFGGASADDSSPGAEPDRTTARHWASIHGDAAGPLAPPVASPAGERARLEVDASAPPNEPTAASGTFTYDHLYRDGTPFVELSGSVDCLMVAGDVVVLTGRVTDTKLPPGAEDTWKGLRVGFMVDDRGHHDRFGWSWQTGNVDIDMPLCTSTIPFQRTDSGDFRVARPTT